MYILRLCANIAILIVLGILYLAFLPIFLIIYLIDFIHWKVKMKRMRPTEAEKNCPYYIDVEAVE